MSSVRPDTRFRSYVCWCGHEFAAKAATRHVPLKRHCRCQFTDKRRAAGLPANVMPTHDLEEAGMIGKAERLRRPRDVPASSRSCVGITFAGKPARSEEHTSELQ